MVTLPSARRTATPEELAYSTMFGIAPHLAQLLAKLASGQRIAALAVDIHRLRKALDPEAIDTIAGLYSLTEVGRLECQQARAQFRSWVRGGEREVA